MAAQLADEAQKRRCMSPFGTSTASSELGGTVYFEFEECAAYWLSSTDAAEEAYIAAVSAGRS